MRAVKIGDKETFEQELNVHIAEVEQLIGTYPPEKIDHQKTIFEVMNHSMKTGRKRLCPILMQEMYRLSVDALLEAVIPSMTAVETIHASSLAHDDLSYMGDDMMCGGRASTWAEYDEDIGMLIGNALMTFAFETTANAFETSIAPDELSEIGRVMGILVHKTGIYGMIEDQTMDVELTRGPMPRDKPDTVYRLKTGALIETPMLIGAVLGGVTGEDCKIAESLTSKIGMAFQIQDDILNMTGSQDVTGRPSRSDEKNKRMICAALEGLERIEKGVERISTEAIEKLNKLLGNSEFLKHLIHALVGRQK